MSRRTVSAEGIHHAADRHAGLARGLDHALPHQAADVDAMTIGEEIETVNAVHAEMSDHAHALLARMLVQKQVLQILAKTLWRIEKEGKRVYTYRD